MRNRVSAFARRHRKLFLALAAGVLVLVFLLRAFLHPAVIALRTHIFVLTIGLPVAWALWYFLRRRTWKVKLAVLAPLAVLVAGVVLGGFSPHEYLALYSRYRSLNLQELGELPTTAHDRIQPHNSIISLANEAMAETETPMTPDFVRVGDSYRWTLAIEPAYTIRRSTQGVRELFNVSGTAPSPNFSRESRVKVDFPTGEGLLLWNNTFVNVIRSFGPWRFLNYEPADVKYIPDDNGEWVQAVSLIRWKGFLFPRPEFGGVQILRQRDRERGNAFTRMFVGAGEWIRPEEISEHRFLQGQNLVPYKVSRYIAHSLRFQNGFWAPFPGYHLGDIRIPDLPEDVNEQPFTIYFEFEGEQPADKLYHYFALEPYQADKQGLNTSLFVPADGVGDVYTYTHHRKNEALTGVSAISPKVMESRKNYDWSRNRPVEHRPYIKKVGGRTRFFWLTTVVTLKDTQSSFIAGSTPDVVLTDAAYKVVTWVNPLKPEEWTAQLEKELSQVWADENRGGK